MICHSSFNIFHGFSTFKTLEIGQFIFTFLSNSVKMLYKVFHKCYTCVKITAHTVIFRNSQGDDYYFFTVNR